MIYAAIFLLVFLAYCLYVSLRSNGDLEDYVEDLQAYVEDLQDSLQCEIDETRYLTRVRDAQRLTIERLLNDDKAQQAEIVRLNEQLAGFDTTDVTPVTDTDQIVFVLAPDETLH